ncbi:Uncharacterized protein dnm_074320 [Desulfonema magnum]|uniref:Uncharacterized protein n=1 Tax=Desulfonema magnum TaxID=45655 RepID=A0A975GRH2_9BACT|nr:Uncharacterized protein dnm_005360 [Desulfonema magnum]QTA88025.1 Uncharacterized protein dnm_040650 [Desulfonema magnum]QTA88811.1 Uncharacterized protein dnm_048580 [Desulfonema magnum]QTA90912.1 Uncharacterized protein dnm_069740 [Desulfonema magnum]QTA91367.1 Uncharacterized protein dnm_074320 [Desulfonema magnum]
MIHKALIKTLIFFVALFFGEDKIYFLYYIGMYIASDIYIASERKNHA